MKKIDGNHGVGGGGGGESKQEIKMETENGKKIFL
jgi:hypothetical protein